jgi:hypothetical protein
MIALAIRKQVPKVDLFVPPGEGEVAMSGGHFDYVQWRIREVAENLAKEAETWPHPHIDE